MFATSIRRMLGLFLLGLTLTTPVFADGFRAPSAAGSPDVLGRLWSFITNLWSPVGCYIDPDGRCAAPPSAVPPATDQMDTGCYIDPNGRCGS